MIAPVVRALRAVAAAFSFLTVLPLGRVVDVDARDVARGSVVFGVVGAAVGALTGGVAWWLADPLPPLTAACLAVALGAAVTGALHLDGLADCADGFGGRTVTDRLRIMRDHSIGTYGVTALVVDLLVRVSVLASLAGSRDALLFSVVAGALSRSVAPLLAVWLPYAQARPGAGNALSSGSAEPRAAAALVIGALVAFACLTTDSGSYAAAVAATAVAVGLVGVTARRRLGGITGDVLGASSELVELAVLVVLVGMR
ncbi:MAG: adenosylcobinamide-GDP ribazoletransferase [Marmoricola sp.]